MEIAAKGFILVKTFKMNFDRTECIVEVRKDDYLEAIEKKIDIIVDCDNNITFYDAEQPNAQLAFLDGDIFLPAYLV